MNKNNDSEYVIIGVRVPRSLCSSLDDYASNNGLIRSSFMRLLLSWFFSSSSRLYRIKFGRYVRDYKSFQRI